MTSLSETNLCTCKTLDLNYVPDDDVTEEDPFRLYGTFS